MSDRNEVEDMFYTKKLSEAGIKRLLPIFNAVDELYDGVSQNE